MKLRTTKKVFLKHPVNISKHPKSTRKILHHVDLMFENRKKPSLCSNSDHY